MPNTRQNAETQHWVNTTTCDAYVPKTTKAHRVVDGKDYPHPLYPPHPPAIVSGKEISEATITAWSVTSEKASQYKIVRDEHHVNRPLVGLGEVQIPYDIDINSDVTMTNSHTWNRYIEYRKENNLKIPDRYEKYEALTKKVKRTCKVQISAMGQTTLAHGPYDATFTIDGFEILIQTFVTDDCMFHVPFILQKECWALQNLTYMEKRRDAVRNTHTITHQSQTKIIIGGRSHPALVDTGAAPSIMSFQCYLDLGGDPGEIKYNNTRLVAANGNNMLCLGQSLPITFWMGMKQYKWPFIVVNELGYEEIILGRDFLNWFDARIDLNKGLIELRNSDHEYTLKAITEIQGQRGNMEAVVTEETTIQPGQICCIEAQIVANKRNTFDPNEHKANYDVYIRGQEGTFEDTEGLCFGHTIATVVDNKVMIPVLNTNLAEPQTIKRSNLRLTVHRVRTKYIKDYDDTPQTDTPHSVNMITHTDDTITPPLIDIDTQVCRLKADFHADNSSTGTSRTLSSKTDSPLSERNDGARMALKRTIPVPSGLDNLAAADKEETKDTKAPFQTRPDIEKLREHMTEEQIQKLNNILDTYEDIFSKTKSDMGHTHLITHDIKLKPDAKDFHEPLRKTSPEKRAIIDEDVDGFMEKGVIKPSQSPFASAVVLAKKQDGTLRFCVDFRRLNDITVRDAYPLPRIDEHLESIGSACYFTSLDMGNAFWQVPLAESAKEKTAFATRKGLYEWQVMPFGLCNATATFQRLMAKALMTITSEYGNLVLCYVDDILIATRTVEQHFDRLEEVFKCIRKAGLKLKAQKCKIMETTIKFLGRLIDHLGMRPDPMRTIVVVNWEPPTTRTQLKSFLGFMNYYREFIYRFSEIAAPLQDLDRKNVDFAWTEAAQAAFEILKEALLTAPILASPAPEGEYVLDTDASAVAIAGVLQQWQQINGQTKLRVISYGSRSLRDAERNYGAPKSEMLAVITFIEKYAPIIGIKHFLLRCDAQALQWLKTWSMEDGVSARWITRLSMMDFRTEHRKREKHTNADGLTKQTHHYAIGEPKPEVAPGFPFLSKEQYDEIEVIPKDALEMQKKSTQKQLLQVNVIRQIGSYTLGRNTQHNQHIRRNITLDHNLIDLTTTTNTPTAHTQLTHPDTQDTDTHTSEILQPQKAQETANVSDRMTTKRDREESPDKENQSPEPRQQSQTKNNLDQAQATFSLQSMTLEDLGTGKEQDNSITDETVKWMQTCMQISIKPRYNTKQLRQAQLADVALLLYTKYTADKENTDEKRITGNLTKEEQVFFHRYKKTMAINEKGILTINNTTAEKPDARPTLILPQLYRYIALRQAHDTMGHMGEKKTLARLQERYTWPGIRNEVTRYVKACGACQTAKGPNPKTVYPLKPISSTYPNELVQIDFEQYGVSRNGYKGLLMCVDHFSKYAEAFPLKEFTSKSAALAFSDGWILKYGAPETLQSDRGSQFESEMFQEFCSFNDIVKKHSTPYHPQSNGLVERQNRTLTTMLKKQISRDQKDWDTHVQAQMFAYNNSIHETTKHTPQELWQYRDPPKIPLWWLFEEYDNSWADPKAKWMKKLAAMPDKFRLVRHQTGQAQIRQKRNHDAKIRNLLTFEIGEEVMVFTDTAPKDGVHKLTPKYRGPFTIVTKDETGHNYRLSNGKLVHIIRLKPFHQGPLHVWKHKDEDLVEYWDNCGNPDNIPATPDASSYGTDGASHASDETVLNEPTYQSQYEMRPRGKPPLAQNDENYIAPQTSESSGSTDVTPIIETQQDPMSMQISEDQSGSTSSTKTSFKDMIQRSIKYKFNVFKKKKSGSEKTNSGLTVTTMGSNSEGTGTSKDDSDSESSTSETTETSGSDHTRRYGDFTNQGFPWLATDPNNRARPLSIASTTKRRRDQPDEADNVPDIIKQNYPKAVIRQALQPQGRLHKIPIDHNYIRTNPRWIKSPQISSQQASDNNAAVCTFDHKSRAMRTDRYETERVRHAYLSNKPILASIMRITQAAQKETQEESWPRETTPWSPTNDPVQTMDLKIPETHGTQYMPHYSRHIKYIKANIFDTTRSMAHGVSADLYMDAGLAKQFKTRFKCVQLLFNQRALPGDIAILTPKDTDQPGQYIYYLVTKTRYFDKPALTHIEKSIYKMIKHAENAGVRSIAMPLLVTGYDEIPWSEVYAILDKALNMLPEPDRPLIMVYRYNPTCEKTATTLRLPVHRIDEKQKFTHTRKLQAQYSHLKCLQYLDLQIPSIRRTCLW